MSAGARDPIVVVGAGIGGLAAAAALRRVGRPVVVLERADAMREIGAALSLGVNAMTALRSLGLADAVRRAGAPVSVVEIRDREGRSLCRVDTADLARRRGVPIVLVHRADLQRVLAEAAGSDVVRLGADCADVRPDEAGVTVRLADGAEIRGAGVVGADGIRSAVRRALGDRTEPRYAGYTCWRGVAPWAVPEGVGVEVWGRARRFGFAPLPGGRTYWYATRNAPQDEAERGVRKDEVLAEFDGWHAPVRDLIEATDAGVLLRHDILDRPPSRAWGRGRVTLLGDAAHAMTPNLGQGACQAIEDAVVLARSLAATGDVAAAFRAYEAARMPRTAAIVRESWRVGRAGQLGGRVPCALRDLAMRCTPSWVPRRSFERVHGWEP